MLGMAASAEGSDDDGGFKDLAFSDDAAASLLIREGEVLNEPIGESGSGTGEPGTASLSVIREFRLPISLSDTSKPASNGVGGVIVSSGVTPKLPSEEMGGSFGTELAEGVGSRDGRFDVIQTDVSAYTPNISNQFQCEVVITEWQKQTSCFRRDMGILRVCYDHLDHVLQEGNSG